MGHHVWYCRDSHRLGIKSFYGGNFAKKLCEKKGRAYNVGFYWGSAEVSYPNEPEIEPNGETEVIIRFTNHFRQPQHMHLHWLLPEGFSVKNCRHDLYLSHENPHNNGGSAEIHCTIVAGENTFGSIAAVE